MRYGLVEVRHAQADVIEQVQGKVKVSTHFDRDGTFVMEIARFSLRHTYTNSETGAALRSQDVGIDKIVVNEDGSGTVAVIGIAVVIAPEVLKFSGAGTPAPPPRSTLAAAVPSIVA